MSQLSHCKLTRVRKTVEETVWRDVLTTICRSEDPTVPPLVGCCRWNLTALFNDSVTSCRIPAIWKSSIVIPIPQPDKDSSLGTSHRPISLLCPAVKVMEAIILTTVNTHLLPAFDQHGFRSGHSSTSALLQLTSDVATGFNERKPPHRTICVAVDLTAAFDTVNHTVLLSKIARLMLPEATC